MAAPTLENLSRIKNNVRKMVDQGAPETDIDAYLGEEGVTPDAIRNFRPSTGEDVARSAGSGLRTGTEMGVGTMGDLAKLPGRAASKVASWLGADPETVEKIGKFNVPITPGAQVAAAVKAFGGPDTEKLYAPTTEQVQEVTKPVLGEPYEPQTKLGKYTRTVAEFGPGAAASPGRAASRVAQALFPGVASEAAGQYVEGTDISEPWARFAGGLAGAFLPGGINRLSRPMGTPSAAQQAANTRLAAEGVDLTAGQSTGSPTLRYMESEIGGAPFNDITQRQQQQFTQAATGRAGMPPMALAAPENLLQNRERLGGEFDRLAAQTVVPLDQQLQNDLLNSTVAYQDVSANVAPVVENVMNRAAELAAQNGGVLSGEAYANLKTYIREMRDRADGTTQNALGEMNEAIDNAVERHLPDPLREEWTRTRNNWRNQLILEDAIASGTGGRQAEATISPARLRASARTIEGKSRTATGRSDLSPLAAAGAEAMPDLPQSGTAPRSMARNPLVVPGLMVNAAMGRALMSPALQGYLGRQGFQLPNDQRALLSAILAGRQAEQGNY